MPYNTATTLSEWKLRVSDVIYENQLGEITPVYHSALLKNIADLLVESLSAASVTQVGTGVGLSGGPITSEGTISIDILWFLSNFAVFGHSHGISEIVNLSAILQNLADAIPADTDELEEGVVNFYFTAEKLLISVISGLDFTDATPIANGETLVHILGKLQAQISAVLGGGTIYAETAPSTSVVENRWVNTTSLKEYFKYNDGDSVQWILVGQTCGAGGKSTALDGMYGLIQVVTDTTYTLMLRAAYPGVITALGTRMGVGTCTVEIQIGGTPLGGSSNSATTTYSEQAHATNNVFAVNDIVTMVITASAASPADLDFVLKMIRIL